MPGRKLEELAEQAISGGLAAAASPKIGPITASVAAPVFVYAAARLRDAISGVRDRNVAEMLAAAVEGDEAMVEELVERTLADRKRAILLASAIDAAVRTALDDKIRALGRAIRAGVLTDDDATVDLAALAVTSLAGIESPHIALLHFLSTATHNRELDMSDPPQWWSRWEIDKRLTTLGPALDPVVQTLLSCGALEEKGVDPQRMIVEREKQIAQGLKNPGFTVQSPKLRATGFGLYVLSLVTGEGYEPAELPAGYVRFD